MTYTEVSKKHNERKLRERRAIDRVNYNFLPEIYFYHVRLMAYNQATYETLITSERRSSSGIIHLEARDKADRLSMNLTQL